MDRFNSAMSHFGGGGAEGKKGGRRGCPHPSPLRTSNCSCLAGYTSSASLWHCLTWHICLFSKIVCAGLSPDVRLRLSHRSSLDLEIYVRHMFFPSGSLHHGYSMSRGRSESAQARGNHGQNTRQIRAESCVPCVRWAAGRLLAGFRV